MQHLPFITQYFARRRKKQAHIAVLKIAPLLLYAKPKTVLSESEVIRKMPIFIAVKTINFRLAEKLPRGVNTKVSSAPKSEPIATYEVPSEEQQSFRNLLLENQLVQRVEQTGLKYRLDEPGWNK